MKLLAVLLVCLPVGLSAAQTENNEGARMATELYVQTLQHVDVEALSAAEEFYRRGQGWQATELDSISNYANQLSRSLRVAVIRDLYRPEAVHFEHAREGWNRSRHDRMSLESSARNLRHGMTPSLRTALDRMNLVLAEVEDEFDGYQYIHGPIDPGPIDPGPIDPVFPGADLRANCSCTFGGNFLSKLSHVKCTLLGRGAEKYSVTFSNAQTGESGKVEGNIERGAVTFNTTHAKKNVGRYANFQVTLAPAHGPGQVVANGQCDGKPF